MATYKYKARDKEGNVYQKTALLEGRAELFDQIKAEGGSIIAIEETKPLAAKKLFGGLFGKIKTLDKIILSKNLGLMIKAGLSVTRALSVLERQSRNKTLKNLLRELSADVSKGETLSGSMQKHPKEFSPLFVSMVKAGEESGNLAESLHVVANQTEKSFLLGKKVRGAMIYPTVIIGVMIIIGILMLTFMVPSLTATFKGLGIELPLSTRMIIYLSDFLVEQTFIVIGAILVLIFLLLSFFKTNAGRKIFDTVSIRIPVIGPLLKEAQSARTARTLASLLTSGVPIVVALTITIDVVQNNLYKEALTRARVAIEKGESMSQVFLSNSHLYPLFVGEMVSVGEETGKISEMLQGIAEYYENEVDQKTKDLSTIIEPILMVVIGGAVGVFAISMLAPTYSLIDNL